jgi:hypothetical protein
VLIYRKDYSVTAKEITMTSGEHVPHWRKSTYSGLNGNCVEVARLAEGRIGVRDSKDPSGPVLAISFDGWNQLIASIKSDNVGGLH